MKKLLLSYFCLFISVPVFFVFIEFFPPCSFCVAISALSLAVLIVVGVVNSVGVIMSGKLRIAPAIFLGAVGVLLLGIYITKLICNL